MLYSTLSALQCRGLSGVQLADEVADALGHVVAAAIDDDEAARILATPSVKRLAVDADPESAMLMAVSQLLCAVGAYRRRPDLLEPEESESSPSGLGSAVVGGAGHD